MKKILLVGEFCNTKDVYFYSNSFVNILKKLGYETKTFNIKPCYFGSKQIGRLRVFEDLFVNISLKNTVKGLNPDLIFFIKANNIYAKTLKWIKYYKKSYLINFYPDNPFVFWNGNSNSNVLKSLPLYDCFLIWSRKLMQILDSSGCKKSIYFPFAYDKNLFPVNLPIVEEEQEDYESDVCFIGTWESDREKWLTELCELMPDLDLVIWGNLWEENLTKNSILRGRLKGRAIYFNKMIKAFRSSKIVLNFVRKQNIDAHNMRTLEVPASGAFLLTQRTKEQSEELFKEGESVECFSTLGELVNKINFYLENDVVRKTIIENSKKEVEKYQLEPWLKGLMDEIFHERNN